MDDSCEFEERSLMTDLLGAFDRYESVIQCTCDVDQQCHNLEQELSILAEVEHVLGETLLQEATDCSRLGASSLQKEVVLLQDAALIMQWATDESERQFRDWKALQRCQLLGVEREFLAELLEDIQRDAAVLEQQNDQLLLFTNHMLTPSVQMQAFAEAVMLYQQAHLGYLLITCEEETAREELLASSSSCEIVHFFEQEVQDLESQVASCDVALATANETYRKELEKVSLLRAALQDACGSASSLVLVQSTRTVVPFRTMAK